jgi:hypothetical protein
MIPATSSNTDSKRFMCNVVYSHVDVAGKNPTIANAIMPMPDTNTNSASAPNRAKPNPSKPTPRFNPTA